jgi:hypothetical protein
MSILPSPFCLASARLPAGAAAERHLCHQGAGHAYLFVPLRLNDEQRYEQKQEPREGDLR